MKRRDVLLGGAALGVGCVTTRVQPTSRQRDVQLVREALALHPGVTRYLTAEQVEAGLETLDSAFSGQATLDARFLALSQFLNSLRCGHSYVNPYNQKRAVVEALFDRRLALPFTFRWIDGELVVTGDHGAGLPVGTRVTSIDGIASREVLARLLPFTRADGTGTTKRIAQLGVSGLDRYEAFDLFHALAFGGIPGQPRRLGVTALNGGRSVIEVAPISLAQRQARRPQAELAADAPRWTWSVDERGVALLTMPSWALYDTKWKWQDWLDERLSSLGSARGLIVDLRDNEGGLDCGNALLSRLTDKPLTFDAWSRRVRFRTTPESLNPFLDTWDDSFRTLGVKARDLGDGFFELPREEEVNGITPTGPRVTQKVAVLIGPVNSSATFQFAWRCQTSGLARLFGEPTGGNRRGINGGCFFFVRLPDSGLEFDLPLIGTFPATAQPDAGIEPDVVVHTTAADLAAQRDPTLTQAKAWLQQGA